MKKKKEKRKLEDERVPMASEQIHADRLLISSCMCEAVAMFLFIEKKKKNPFIHVLCRRPAQTPPPHVTVFCSREGRCMARDVFSGRRSRYHS